MSAASIGFALLLVGVLLVGAKLVRVRSRTAQKLFLPSSIIGGAIALLLGPDVLGGLAGLLGHEGALADGAFSQEVRSVWEELPGLLISVVFATLFLGVRLPRARDAVHLGGPQLCLGATMGAGQYVIGILLGLLVLAPVFGLDPLAGALIEIGFEGGHGTAAGLGDTFEELGFTAGEDLALGLATIGIVSGIVVGVAMINWAVRTGRTGLLAEDAQASLREQQGLFERDQQPTGALMTVRPSSVEPLAIHVGIVAVAVLLGQGALSSLQALERALWIDSVELFTYVPLFPLAMLGGVVVQKVVDRVDHEGVVDRMMMMRIQGLALDVLIVAALATLSLDVIAEHIGAFAVLAVAGVGWNIGAFLLLARRMIPEWWFERGVADLGQSMGVTATGLVLLRVVDPEAHTPALEAFGYKQLGFEPFFGGGLVTATSLPLIAQFGPVPFLIAMAVVVVVAVGVGVGHFGRRDPDPAVLEPRGGSG